MLTSANSLYWLNLILQSPYVVWDEHTNTHGPRRWLGLTHTQYAYPSYEGMLFEVIWGLSQLVFICDWRHWSFFARKPLRHRTPGAFPRPTPQVYSVPTWTSLAWPHFMTYTLNMVKLMLIRWPCYLWKKFNDSWKALGPKWFLTWPQ